MKPRRLAKRKAGLALTRDPTLSAKAADLRYVDDGAPGIERRSHKKGFRYLRPDGAPVRDEATLARIRSLVIPPAWTDVWICPSPDGHIQATGRDARGRKQYRYHARFRQVRDETKYARMLEFAAGLPKIRRRVDADLNLPGLPREKVLATVVRLLESTLIRVGNEEYARENASFGLTTLRSRHVDVTGSAIRFRFRGKSGIQHRVEVQDRRVAKVIARCSDLPGQVLFQYEDDDGAPCTIESAEVNEYIRTIAGADFTAKDFRTWAGTVLCARQLQRFGPSASASPGDRVALPVAARKKNVVLAIREVSSRLGNTAVVCRKCYVHPEVLGAYLDDALHIGEAPPSTRRGDPSASADQLYAYETAVLAFLKGRLGARAPAARAA